MPVTGFSGDRLGRFESMIATDTPPSRDSRIGSARFRSNNQLSRFAFITALLPVFLLAWGLRLFRLGLPPAWHDETYTALVALRPVGDIVALSAADIHPPLHFLLLHFWIPLGGNGEFSLRFISVAWGMLAVALIAALGRTLYGKQSGVLAAVLLAVSPFAVAYAQEIRMYSMLLALGLAAGYALLRWVREGRTVFLISYVLLALAALYTNYYAATILAAHAIWIGLLWLSRVWRRKLPAVSQNGHAGHGSSRQINPEKFLLLYALAGIAVIVLYLPQLAVALRQITGYTVSLLKPLAPEEFFLQLWQAYVMGTAIDSLWFPQLDMMLPAFAGLSVLLLLVNLLYYRKRFSTTLLPLLWLVVPVTAMFLLTMRRPFFHPRFLLLALPAYLLLCSGGLAALWQAVTPLAQVQKQRALRWREGLFRLGQAALALLCIFVMVPAFVPGLQSYYFNPRFARDDTRSLAAWLESHATAQDAIVIDVEFALDYYYHGAAPQHYMLADEKTSAQQLSAFAGNARRIFLVNWYQADADPKGYIPYLLDRYGRRDGKQEFQGYTVTVWDMPAPVDFTAVDGWNATSAHFGNRVDLVAQAYGGASGVATPTVAPACPDRGSICKPPDAPSGERVWVDLRWRVTQQLDKDYMTVVYLRDQAGHTVAQSDRAIFSNTRLSASHLSPGDEVDVYYTLPIESGTMPGSYMLEAAVYDPATLQKLDAVAASGTHGQVVSLGPVQVTRQLSTPTIDMLGIQHQVNQNITGDVRLLGYDLAGTNVKPGDMMNLTLYWQATQSVRQNYLLALHVSGADKRVLASEIITPTYATSNWQQGETLRDHESLLLPANLPAGAVQLSVALLDPETQAVHGEVPLASLAVQGRPHSFDVPPIAHRQQARFGSAGRSPYIELLGYDLSANTAKPGGTLTLKLYWRCITSPPQNYTVFTQLLDGQNRIWAQSDKPPVIPTAGWVPGEVFTETYSLGLKPDTPIDGSYRIITGLYDPANGGQRLVLLDASGKALETYTTLDLQVQVGQ